MSRIPLVSAAYAGQSVIASGQECVNLYAEINATFDPQAPVLVTYYQTPGTKLFSNPNVNSKVRGAYRTSIDTAYYVVGPNVFFLTSAGLSIQIGSIVDTPSQVYFKDNGLAVVLVDGVSGYAIDMASNNFAKIIDLNFLGADYVELIQTFFIFNRPATNQFYITASNASYGMLTSTAIGDGTIVGGSGYADGVYQNVALTGGSGSGATATIEVTGGIVDTVDIGNSGQNYVFGDILTADLDTLGNTPPTIIGGAGYVDGTYNNVPLTGGSGVGATANITVAGGTVTTVVTETVGTGYIHTDVLSADASDIGGSGSGFTYALGGYGFTFTVTSPASPFDPLDIAAKSGFNDPIVGLASVHNELWLVGNLTTEIWVGTGAADFFFQQVQGAYVNHGSSAKYSVASQDVLIFFLQQDMQGNGLVLVGQGYDVTEISTPRIVKEFKSYVTLSDAIGFCFQVSDHSFYALVFPTANKGWLYDLGTKQWCEWNFCDTNGGLNRPRANCCMFAFGLILVGDVENGNILQLDPDTFTDYVSAAQPALPITRIRTFPHLIDNNERVTTLSFDADMEVGTIGEDMTPTISLSWSDNKGVSYGNPVIQTMGKIGDFLTTISWNRLGQARDRVFKLQWSENLKTALNGGFIERKKART